jgi:hypothetical protein
MVRLKCKKVYLKDLHSVVFFYLYFIYIFYLYLYYIFLFVYNKWLLEKIDKIERLKVVKKVVENKDLFIRRDALVQGVI